MEEKKNAFYSFGLANSKGSLTCSVMLFVTGIYSIVGLLSLVITNDPQDLWVDTSGELFMQQTFSDDNFGRFYRPEQMFFYIRDTNLQDSNIVDKDYLTEVFYFTEAIKRTKIEYMGKDYYFEDLCWTALPESRCTIQTPLGYWQNNLTRLNEDQSINGTLSCLKSIDPNNVLACFDDSGIPVQQNVVFGGVTKFFDELSGCQGPKVGDDDDCKHYNITAKRLIVSMLLRDQDDINPINELWEKNSVQRIADLWMTSKDNQFLRDILIDYDIPLAPLKLSVNYMVGRSIEDELQDESKANAFVVAFSYILMLLYISVGLGRFPNKIGNTFGVGLVGVFLVIVSVIAGYATLSYLNIKASLICLEVIPFLILAIGVDNMFIIAQAVDRQPIMPDIHKRVALAIEEVGPSITVAFVTELVTFGVGILTKIPALKVFCVTAVSAIVFNYILQMTVFVHVYTKDLIRRQERRLDLAFWIRDPNAEVPKPNTFFRDFFTKSYTPMVTSKVFITTSLIIAAVLVALGPFSFSSFKFGIEPQLSTISGGNLYNYFNDLDKFLATGPPLYIVMDQYQVGDDLTNQQTIQLLNILDLRKDLVKPPVQNWLIDYQKYFDSTDLRCQPDQSLSLAENFQNFLRITTNDYCCQNVGICGSQYAVHVKVDVKNNKVGPGRIALLHSALDSQEAYIRNLQETRQIVNWFDQDFRNKLTDLRNQGQADINGLVNGYSADQFPKMYAQSVFYTFFEQYDYIKGVALGNFALALVILFTITTVVFSITIGLYMALLIGCVVLSMVTLLQFTNFLFSNQEKGKYPVRMNAVSVVNLVTAIGFAVEFCIHTLLKYQNTSGSKVKRIQKALNEMGSSVFSGIFITKMLGNLYLIRSNFQGIFVLGFAPSPIFKLYYFRMYMIMILTCGFYGLCVLPGFIYIFGSDSTEEEKILENAKDEELEHINLKAKQDQNLDFEGYQDMNQEDREALKDSQLHNVPDFEHTIDEQCPGFQKKEKILTRIPEQFFENTD